MAFYSPLRRPWLPTGNGKCPPPRSPWGLRHTSRGSELGTLRAAELVPVPPPSGVPLCSAGIAGSWAVPTASPCSRHPPLAGLGVRPRGFTATGTPKACGRDTPCSAGSGNCVSFPQSLVQSRKAGITSALASSTLNNEELVGAGVGWARGWSWWEG